MSFYWTPDVKGFKQDKSGDVILRDKTKYVGKYLSIINNGKFEKSDKKPTVTYKTKIQRSLRRMKSRITQQKYKKLYPTWSNAVIFYGSAKVYKPSELGMVEQ